MKMGAANDLKVVTQSNSFFRNNIFQIQSITKVDGLPNTDAYVLNAVVCIIEVTNARSAKWSYLDNV